MQARKHLNRLIGTALTATKEGEILSLLSHGLIPLKKKRQHETRENWNTECLDHEKREKKRESREIFVASGNSIKNE